MIHMLLLSTQSPGVKFGYKAEVAMQIAVRELLALANIYYQLQAFSKSNMIDQVICISIYSYCHGFFPW